MVPPPEDTDGAVEHMTYPRVRALRYIIEHDSSIDYSEAQPLSRHEASFVLHVEDRRVCFTMKESYATAKEALEAIGPYIDGWELKAGLQHGPNKFKLRFGGADLEDIDPKTKQVIERSSALLPLFMTGEVRVTEGVPYYPSPPSIKVSLNPDVRSMFDRYLGYRGGREHLTTMAYFCLTVLETSTGKRRNARLAAAKQYGISKAVLAKIGWLTSKKGGTRARKASGIRDELSQDETRFLDEAVKAIICRTAECAHDPNTARRTITMKDLTQN